MESDCPVRWGITGDMEEALPRGPRAEADSADPTVHRLAERGGASLAGGSAWISSRASVIERGVTICRCSDGGAIAATTRACARGAARGRRTRQPAAAPIEMIRVPCHSICQSAFLRGVSKFEHLDMLPLARRAGASRRSKHESVVEVGHLARNPGPAHLVDIGRVTEFVTEPPPERAGHWRRGRSGFQRAVHRRKIPRSRGGALTLAECGGDFLIAAIDCNLSGVYHYYATQRPTFYPVAFCHTNFSRRYRSPLEIAPVMPIIGSQGAKFRCLECTCLISLVQFADTVSHCNNPVAPLGESI